MKKLLLVFSCIFSVLAMAQEVEKPYDFPVKPGTEQWAKLSSSKEMDEVCIIPDRVLSNLSTKALLITCLNYPRIIDFFLMDNLQSGFNFYAKHFNGLEELVKRPDLNKILFQSYLDIDLPKAKMSGYDHKLTFMQIAFLELLISQETIINHFEKNEKLILLKEAIKKLEQRQKLGESLYRQTTSALILSRILYSENNHLSEYDKYGNDIFSVFNSFAIIIDTLIINKLLMASKEIK
ncbi:hypothetical protein ES705_36078 [subsurface metagenome]